MKPITSYVPHYPNAPITEAIIDIHIAPSDRVTLESLSAFAETQKDRYPEPNKLHQWHAKLDVGKDNEVEQDTKSSPIGFMVKCDQEPYVLQLRLNGFTLSRLAPYQRWENLRDEARMLWDRYLKSVSPANVSRVAVRYVNRLDLPLPFDDFKMYLRTVPEISPDLPQALTGFLMQAVIPQVDIDSTLILTQHLIPPSCDGVASVAMDIDLYKAVAFQADTNDVWDLLEVLHVRKNKIFEACITDATRELFK